MDKNKILTILNDWNFWHQDLPYGLWRKDYLQDFQRYLKTNQIVVIKGPRRAGKSYLMRQAIKELIQQGIPSSQILMINFEDPRFPKLDSHSLQKIYEVYLEAKNPNSPIYLFLDEIQEVDQWEKWVRTMHELGKAKLIISGSNSKLLSQELATLLTGRHLGLEVLPFSYEEQAEFQKIELSTFHQNPVAQSRFLGEILEYGSFPEIVQSEAKKEILLNYFDDILNKDLIQRYHIRKTENLKSLASFYLSQVASQTTYSSIKKFLSLTTSTVEKFSSYLEETYLLFFIKRFSYKVKEQEKSPRKVYAVDTGLANAIGFRQGQNKGRLAENYVFLKLYREKLKNPNLEIYYWKNPQHREVDFVIRDNRKITKLIQVCWDMSEPQTRERELKSLVLGLKEFNLSEGLIITHEEEGFQSYQTKTIHSIPLWKWMMLEKNESKK